MSKTFDITKRSTLRGFKKCSNCGEIQGQRKLICSNEYCELRQKILTTQIPFDPIRLISKIPSTSLFSVRVKEKSSQPRSFTEITEIALAIDGSSIISKNAICYDIACRNFNNNNNKATCKHVKACNPATTPIPNAEVYPLAREVLWNLNIDAALKQRLWNAYTEDESLVPAIQRLNQNTFVVKCMKSKVFPAGRLHVTALSNITVSSKKTPYACACKKLKIILEADNSVVIQDICDHLLLVLSAVLSKPNGKHIYKSFMNALKSFWMPTELEKPLSTQEDAFFGLDINIGGNFGEIVDDSTSPNDIFIFDDQFLNDDNLPDFTDIVLDLTPADLFNTEQNQSLQASISNNETTTAPLLLHAGDPNLVSSCNINEDIDICFDDIVSNGTQTKPSINQLNTTNAFIDEVNIDSSTQLELSDCNIELMDQFQLTDRIDLCSEDIALQTNSTTSIFEHKTNSINILTANPNTSTTTPITISDNYQPSPSLPFYEQQNGTQLQAANTSNTNSLLKRNHNLLPSTRTTTLEAPTIELPTITVVKKTPVKATEIISEIKTRKYPYIPAKRALIVNTPSEQMAQESVHKFISTEMEPSLAYTAWLEYVIEAINDTIEITEQTEISHTFHVHEEIFSHFSKTFSVGIRRRIPNSTTIVKSGKHKGLIKYKWYFSTSTTVRRIFSTKNISLQLERSFEKTNDGNFIPFIRSLYCDTNSDSKTRRIHPKLALYSSSICFDCNSEHQKAGFKIEWLPNAFPKSHFGILKIEFSITISDPNDVKVN